MSGLSAMMKGSKDLIHETPSSVPKEEKFWSSLLWFPNHCSWSLVGGLGGCSGKQDSHSSKDPTENRTQGKTVFLQGRCKEDKWKPSVAELPVTLNNSLVGYDVGDRSTS